MPQTETVLAVNARVNKLQGIGSWRRLYLGFISALEPRSVLEVGSGDPAFLAALPSRIRRLALDGNAALAPLHRDHGIDFQAVDFDRESLPLAPGSFDVAVSSDLFEHLLYPQKTLEELAGALAAEGVLLSHVPNEFRLSKTSRIMFGRASSVYFHDDSTEWNNPHLRRFTDRGYRLFLGLSFAHNLKLTDLTYSRWARLVKRLGLPVPYCLEGGPTYASTNDRLVFERLVAIKAEIGA